MIRDVFLEDNQKSYLDNIVKKGFIKGDLKIYNEDIVKIEFLGSIKDTSFIISNELPEFKKLLSIRLIKNWAVAELVPYDISFEEIQKHNPKGIIFSGGPSSVYILKLR